MKKLGILALGVMFCICCILTAFAQDEPAPAAADETAATAETTSATAEVTAETVAPPAEPSKAVENAYGFTADDIAVNQAVVAYWYAHGYANAFGMLPAKWADLEDKKLPLRKFESPFTGEMVDFDDGSLDFDGDMTYAMNGCDAMIQVQTAAGVVTIPGMLQSTWNCPQKNCNSCNPCGSCYQRCPKMCDVTICGWEDWGCMCPDEAVCKIIQWMMWLSFETFECRYGQRPCDDMMWMASGFAPVDKNWKELAPQMYIEYIYHKCSLVKAKVHCCSPCETKCGSPCQSKCNSCAKSGGTCGKPSCGKCASKCGKPSCGSCGKSSCGGKSKCNSCGDSKCGGKCYKSKCNSCGSSSCNGGCSNSRYYHSRCSGSDN